MPSLVLPLLASLLAGSGDDDPLPRLGAEITAAELSSHVHFLASDELKGRWTGAPETDRAARYLARVLAESGLAPAGDDGGFLQAVEVARFVHVGPPKLGARTSTGEALEATYGVDFQVSVEGEPRSTGELALRWVRRLEDLPEEARPGEVLVLDATRMQWREWLERRGMPDGAGWGLVLRLGADEPGEASARLPRAGRSALSEAADPVDWVEARGALKARLVAGEVAALRLTYAVEAERIRSYNVVAEIAGAGTPERPELAREAVVFSAHYDHIGTTELRGRPAGEGGDSVYNGADDDASGVACVLELAGALAAGPAPARTLVFLLATGEERGLWGTYHYIRAPAVPMERTVCNLNFEMLGRPDELVGGAGRMWLTGFERTNLGPRFAADGLAIAPDARPEQNFFWRSDNRAFVEQGIVGQTLSTFNLHDDYHELTDEADRIDYEHMQACTRSALAAASILASGDFRPEWNEGEPEIRGRR